MTSLTILTGSRQALLVDTTDDLDFVVFHQDSSGNAVNLTGYVLDWSFTIGAVTISATVANGRLVVDALAGKITLHIAVADLTLFGQGLGKHRLQITSPTNKTLMRGALVNDT
jgi:hypothetical protein